MDLQSKVEYLNFRKTDDTSQQRKHEHRVKVFRDFLDKFENPRLFNREQLSRLSAHRNEFNHECFVLAEDEGLDKDGDDEQEFKLRNIRGTDCVVWLRPFKSSYFGTACEAAMELKWFSYECLADRDYNEYRDNCKDDLRLRRWNSGHKKDGSICAPAMLTEGSTKKKFEIDDEGPDVVQLGCLIDLLSIIWEGSQACVELVAAIKAKVPSTPQITKIVCCGLGGYSGITLTDRRQYNNTMNYLMVQTIFSTLTTKYGHSDIQIFAESKDYTIHDKRSAREVGFEMEVLPDVQGLLEIDNTTLVVYTSPGPRSHEAPVYDILGDAFEPEDWPAAILGPAAALDDASELSGSKRLATPRCKEVLAKCDISKFDGVKAHQSYLDFFGPPILWNMELYTRFFCSKCRGGY